MNKLLSFSGRWYLFKTKLFDSEGNYKEFFTTLRRKYYNKNNFDKFKINFDKDEIKDIINLFCK